MPRNADLPPSKVDYQIDCTRDIENKVITTMDEMLHIFKQPKWDIIGE
jgi:hypothetical protein